MFTVGKKGYEYLNIAQERNNVTVITLYQGYSYRLKQNKYKN